MFKIFRHKILNFRLRRAISSIPINAAWGVEIAIHTVDTPSGEKKYRTLKTWLGHDRLSETLGQKQINRVQKILDIPKQVGSCAHSINDNPYPINTIEFLEFESAYINANENKTY
ncbi:hypothetical protein [Photobacterium angustum]|uniref:Uncharacterized protein n=1 Tax=Photobacterium angustum TaxID=661 RepID=A0ABX5H198_PHOAN|nr:hypothetical protein [Photobacterium angustum]PSX07069.1 hypothetical protein C0W27_15990 [Photobacterium angustum]